MLVAIVLFALVASAVGAIWVEVLRHRELQKWLDEWIAEDKEQFMSMIRKKDDK